MMRELREEHSLATLSNVVAGIPGPLDSRSGLVKSPTILSGWVQLAPAIELQRLLDVPVRVENDAVLGAYGELNRGAGRPFEDFLYVKASHGIGASVIIGRKTYRGATGLAGEIGHINLPGRTESCRCGNRGCLEAVVSVTEIRHQIAHSHPNSAPIDFRVDPDEITTRILNEAGRTLGNVLAVLCDLLNPGALIVGGELGEAGHPFIDGVCASIDRRSQPATAAAVEVLPAALGVRAELVGALELAASSVAR
jgi:predicted NBD/HSP70 family sugar kinase